MDSGVEDVDHGKMGRAGKKKDGTVRARRAALRKSV
jgi:hypothetical protein